MTGLRLPIAKLRKRLQKARSQIVPASQFMPELRKFASKALADCIEDTPVRDLALIEAAQQKQYDLRIGYIPTNHKLQNPSLIVKPSGQHWLFMNGKWYHANAWKLTAPVFAAYQSLLSEHVRRKRNPPRRAFINNRAQARFLYQKSWHQVAKSAGLALSVASNIRNARTRRKPKVEPARGYAQWRGGKETIALVISNPFLEQPSRYKPFSGRRILAKAITRNRPAFMREVKAKVSKIIANASR